MPDRYDFSSALFGADALLHPDADRWYTAGELPPVGTRCWFQASSDGSEDDDPWNPKLRWKGCEVEILAHYQPIPGEGYTWVAVFAFDCTDGDAREVTQAIARCFRPLKPMRQRYEELFLAYTKLEADHAFLRNEVDELRARLTVPTHPAR